MKGDASEVRTLLLCPNHRRLTEEQQALRDKLAYCSDSPAPVDEAIAHPLSRTLTTTRKRRKKKKTTKKESATTKP